MRYWIADTVVARTPTETDRCEVYQLVTHTWQPAPDLVPEIRVGEVWRPVTAADALEFVAGLGATG